MSQKRISSRRVIKRPKRLQDFQVDLYSTGNQEEEERIPNPSPLKTTKEVTIIPPTTTINPTESTNINPTKSINPITTTTTTDENFQNLRDQNNQIIPKPSQIQNQISSLENAGKIWRKTITKELNQMGIGNPNQDRLSVKPILTPALHIQEKGINYLTMCVSANDKNGKTFIPEILKISQANQIKDPLKISKPGQIEEINEKEDTLKTNLDKPILEIGIDSLGQTQGNEENRQSLLHGSTAQSSKTNLTAVTTQNELKLQKMNYQPERFSQEPQMEPLEFSEEYQQEPQMEPQQEPQMEPQMEPQLEPQLEPLLEPPEFQMEEEEEEEIHLEDRPQSLNRTKRANPFATLENSGPPNKIQKIFYDKRQPLSYSRLDFKKFKEQNPELSRRKPINEQFQQNPVIATGLFTTLFADSIEAYKFDGALNAGYRYILVLICGLSRQLRAYPMKKLNSKEATKGLNYMFQSMDLPGHSFFCSDQGKEFKGKTKYLLDEMGMMYVPMVGPNKASMAERVM